LQLLKREAGKTGEIALALALQLRKLACQRACQSRFTAAVTANKSPAFASVKREIGKRKFTCIAKTKRALRNLQ